MMPQTYRKTDCVTMMMMMMMMIMMMTTTMMQRKYFKRGSDQQDTKCTLILKSAVRSRNSRIRGNGSREGNYGNNTKHLSIATLVTNGTVTTGTLVTFKIKAKAKTVTRKSIAKLVPNTAIVKRYHSKNSDTGHLASLGDNRNVSDENKQICTEVFT
jgi:hypothetical protein